MISAFKKAYKAYTGSDIRTILEQHFVNSNQKDNQNQKSVVLVIGPTGSGKSNFISNLYKLNVINLPYFNSKRCAGDDKFFSSIVGDEGKCETLKKHCESMAENYIKSGLSFCYETNSLSGDFNLAQIAKENGYEVKVFYVYTDSHNINLDRAPKYVNALGKDYMEASLNRQDEGMKEEIIKVIPYCDHLYFFNNSKNLEQTIIANKDDDMNKS